MDMQWWSSCDISWSSRSSSCSSPPHVLPWFQRKYCGDNKVELEEKYLEKADASPGGVSSLYDLAACVAGKNLSCKALEQHQPPLDDRILKKVAFWACPQNISIVKAYANVVLRGDSTWKEGEKCVIENMTQVGFMVTANVENSAGVSFTVERQHVTSSTCELCPDKIWCCHVIGAVLHRIKHAREIPVYPPLTETLLAMSRDQLQKLIQYAINENPTAVLGRAFLKMAQIQDPTSELSMTYGAPDPTYGLDPEKPTNLELITEEIRDSFTDICRSVFLVHLSTKCSRIVANRAPNAYTEEDKLFPNPFVETHIRTKSVYKKYLQRVVDLVVRDQIETAGRVLISVTLATRNLISSEEESQGYILFLKTVEKMCSLYILQFTGEARKDLILLCQDLNRKLNVKCSKSKWAELPPVSSLYPQESFDVPGVLGGRQTSLFYEPLCVPLVPSPPQDFYDLLSGEAEPENSTYDEPLPLMVLRFEAIRLWRRSHSGEKGLFRLGVVILRKLLRMTLQLSVLSKKDGVTNNKKAPISSGRKRKVDEEIEDTSDKELPVKKGKLSPLRINGASKQEHTEDFPLPSPCGAGDSAVVTDEPNVEDSVESGEPKMEKGKTEPHASGNLDQMLDSLELSYPDYLQLMLDSLHKDDVVSESVPKETLCYCLIHMCLCLSEEPMEKLCDKMDNEFLALGMLIALELSRYHTAAENSSTLSRLEHQALYTREEQMIFIYIDNIESGKIEKQFLSELHRLYMKKICECNSDGACFFDCGLPFLLISVLTRKIVRRTLGENQNLGHCLYLHALCHSHEPTSCFVPPTEKEDERENKDSHTKLESFARMTNNFIRHMTQHPERDFWLLKLLEHYERVQDRAVFFLFKALSAYPVSTESSEVWMALVKFLLQCIRIQNRGVTTGRFRISPSFNLRIIANVHKKLEIEFLEVVLNNWKEVITFFNDDQILKLKNMLESHTVQGVTPTAANAVFNFFAGTFQHHDNDCVLLDIFTPGDKNMDEAVSVIKQNIDNFTPYAVLYAAYKYNQHQKSSQEKKFSEKVFSDDVEWLVKRALKGLAKGEKPCHYFCGPVKEVFVPLEEPNSRIQWLFHAFNEEKDGTVANSSQVNDILPMVLEVFTNDIITLMSLCSIVENQKLFYIKCKSVFGRRVVEILQDSVNKRLDFVCDRQKYYNDFRTYLLAVKDYFLKYAEDGSASFEVLMKDLRRRSRWITGLKSILEGL